MNVLVTPKLISRVNDKFKITCFSSSTFQDRWIFLSWYSHAMHCNDWGYFSFFVYLRTTGTTEKRKVVELLIDSSSRREQQLHCGEKASAKKKSSWKTKGGRVTKKYEVPSHFKSISPDLLSTSPESPVHGAAGPRLVVRANPMFDFLEAPGGEDRVRALGAWQHRASTLA